MEDRLAKQEALRRNNPVACDWILEPKRVGGARAPITYTHRKDCANILCA